MRGVFACAALFGVWRLSFLCTDYIRACEQNKEDKPLKSIPVHDYLKTKLCDLYENDCIFDKFECTVSSNANFLLTGSYGQYFFV